MDHLNRYRVSFEYFLTLQGHEQGTENRATETVFASLSLLDSVYLSY